MQRYGKTINKCKIAAAFNYYLSKNNNTVIKNGISITVCVCRMIAPVTSRRH